MNEKRRLFLRRLCDKSLYHFIKIVGGSVNQGADISPIIHKPLCLLTQDNSIKFKFKFMPRKWRKSTCFTKWANIWRYLQNPEIRILIPSENENIGSRFLLFIENQLLRNKMLRYLYWDKLYQINDQWINNPRTRWSGTQCELPREGIYSEATYTVIGVGGAAQSGHYDVISPDDLIGKAAMESPETVMQGVFTWFDNIEELTVDESSIIDGCGTHWCLGDFGCYVQEKYPKYQWMIVPYLKDEALEDAENVKWIQNPNVNDSESNYPEVFSTESAIEMLNNPERRRIFFTQQQNNPKKAEEFNKLDPEWLRYYTWETRPEGKFLVCDDGEAYSLREMQKYGIIDPGGFAEVKVAKKGSNNAFLIGGQPRGSIRKFVTYIYFGKMKEPSKFREAVFTAHGEQNPFMWRIEVFGQQGYIFKDLKEAAKKEGLRFRIMELDKDNSENAKHLRMQSVIPVMENGEIFVHKNMKKLIAEISHYPSIIGGCDLLDCLGWINQEYWTRNPKALTNARQSQDARLWEIQQATEGSRTGYG